MREQDDAQPPNRKQPRVFAILVVERLQAQLGAPAE